MSIVRRATKAARETIYRVIKQYDGVSMNNEIACDAANKMKPSLLVPK